MSSVNRDEVPLKLNRKGYGLGIAMPGKVSKEGFALIPVVQLLGEEGFVLLAIHDNPQSLDGHS